MPETVAPARLVLAALAAALVALPFPARAQAPAPATAAAPRPVSDAAFCIRAQQLVARTTLVPKVVRHETWASFKDSKSTIQPFEIHQFVAADEQARQLPALVSCKLKSADHIAAVYGASAAAPDRTTRACTAVDEDTIERIFASLTPAERARVKIRREDIVLDPEQVTWIGPSWLEPFRYAYTSGGRLHLATKALVVNWEDLLWKLAPDRVRGVHYCHVIAPEHLRRLVLGEAGVPDGPG